MGRISPNLGHEFMTQLRQQTKRLGREFKVKVTARSKIWVSYCHGQTHPHRSITQFTAIFIFHLQKILFTLKTLTVANSTQCAFYLSNHKNGKLSTHFRIGLEEFLCNIFLMWTSNGSLYIWRSGDWEGTRFVSDVNASGSRRYVDLQIRDDNNQQSTVSPVKTTALLAKTIF